MAGEKGATFANQLLKLVFQGTAISGIADNASSAPITSIWCSLHVSDPTASGNQASSEIGYTSYARVAVVRTSSGFTVTTNFVSPASPISFPAGTGGSGTATYLGIGTASSGAGVLLYAGPISPAIVCGNGITPIIGTSSTVTEL